MGMPEGDRVGYSTTKLGYFATGGGECEKFWESLGARIFDVAPFTICRWKRNPEYTFSSFPANGFVPFLADMGVGDSVQRSAAERFKDCISCFFLFHTDRKRFERL